MEARLSTHLLSAHHFLDKSLYLRPIDAGAVVLVRAEIVFSQKPSLSEYECNPSHKFKLSDI